MPVEWRMVEALFDHVPDTVFFVKDIAGRYVAVNQALVGRAGRRMKSELIGRRPTDLFPGDLGSNPSAQDAVVLRTGRPLRNRLELHWYARGRPGWCCTTKLPLRDADGRIIGLVGISRDIRAPGDLESIPARLADTLAHMEEHVAEPVSPVSLARRAGLSSTRFARLIKRIFRLSPRQLITQTRLAAAAQLLAESGRSVADIALACGFHDHSAFTRAFRSATGQTPTDFRSRSVVRDSSPLRR
jgi:PAS domain S-box-containing protein